MIPISDPFILFIRHGERAPLPSDDPYADVDLTPEGYAGVSRFAESVAGRLAWTAASPFLRCRVTARGLGPVPEVDYRLGQHGPWIRDHAAAGREFASRGTEGVVRAQVAGVSLAGIREPQEAVPILLSAGLDRVHRGSGACVTHDAILMPAMAWLFGPDAVDEWLAPLGGFAVRWSDSGPVACWRGRQRPC
jgi:broad specificity phosphatase PhoE